MLANPRNLPAFTVGTNNATSVNITWESPATESRETLVTVDFIPKGKATEIVVTHERLPESARPSHSNGWTSAIEKLAIFVEARS